MIGLRGSLGDPDVSFDTEWFTEDHSVGRFEDDTILLITDFHDIVDERQPAESVDKNALFWVWGELYGMETASGYVPRQSVSVSSSDADYCAHLFDEFGYGFVDGLNSEFAGVIYEPEEQTVSLYTDRLGSRPIYYDFDGERLVFATNLVDLYHCDAVDLTYNPSGLYQYLCYERPLGIETPFSSAKLVPPGSVLTFDLAERTISTKTYWAPSYEPETKSFNTFVTELSQVFEAAIAERTTDSLATGLFVSGGADSRLIASFFDGFERAYHMNDHRNREYRLSKEVAETVGVPFEYLKRDPGYYARVLGEYGPLINFSGWFDQAHATGFRSQVTSESDVLFIGQYADTIFGHYIPQVNLPVPLLNTSAQIPVRRRISTISEYRSLYAIGHDELSRGGTRPEFLQPPTIDPLSFIDGNVPTVGGVRYGSFLDFLVAGMYYPLTNTKSYPFYESLLQIAPVRMPFLDNRVVDVALSLPLNHLLRTDVATSVLNRRDGTLASIPHAESGLPLSYPSLAHTVGVKWTRLKRELDDESINAGPWPDHGELIRQTGFIGDALTEHESLLEQLPIFDRGAVADCYAAHLDGADRTSELYSLASFLAIQGQYAFSFDEDGTW